MNNPWNKKDLDKKNEEHVSDVRYIKPDDLKSIEKDFLVKKGMFGKSYKWGRQGQNIARSISKSEMGGILSKNVKVQPNEIAVIVQDGKVLDVVESGKVRVGGLLKTDGYFKDVDVVMMDTSPKDAKWQVGELWTNDKYEIAAKGLLRYRIADPKKFFIMVYSYSSLDEKGERFLSLEHINEGIKSEVLTRVLQPEINNINIEDIYGNRDFQIKLENELDRHLKQTLDMWGLELLKFTSEWDLGDYTRLVRIRREFERREDEEELGTLSAERNIEREGRVNKAIVRKKYEPILLETDFENKLKLINAEMQAKLGHLETILDSEETKQAIELHKLFKQMKIEAKTAEVEIDQGVADKEHRRIMEILDLTIEKESADTGMENKEEDKYPNKQLEKMCYCMYCGTPMQHAYDHCPNRKCGMKPGSGGENTRPCISCGKELDDKAKFCTECSTRQPEQTGTAANLKEIKEGVKDEKPAL